MSTNLVKSNENAAVKLPPQSVEAEEAILGAILTNPVCLNKVVEYLDAATFYKPAHRHIYKAILKLYADNLRPEGFTDPSLIDRWYNGHGGFHRMYVAAIEHIWTNDSPN